MALADDIIKQSIKTYGEGVAKVGVELEDVERIPTGIFSFDLQTGGGFPMGKCSEVYGPESSGKTNLLLCAIAQFQRLYPDLKVVFIDVEHAFDATWATKMGVNCDTIILVQPHNAEQAVDFMDGFSECDDVGLIGLDSIAALIPENEVQSGADKASVGGSSALVGKMYRKMINNQLKLANRGFYPTIICINQIRFKIGVMFGNPETTPGGNAPRFYSSLRARIYGTNVIEKAINPELPAYKKTSVQLVKWKVPIVGVNSEYHMAMIDTPDLNIGEVESWNTLSSYAKDYGMLYKEEDKKKQWVLTGDTFEEVKGDTLLELKELVKYDFSFGTAVRSELIAKAMELGHIPPQDDKGKKGKKGKS